MCIAALNPSENEGLGSKPLLTQMQDPQAVVLSVLQFDPGRFAISSIYTPALIFLYKQMASRPVWHPSKKLWAFKDESYEELMQKLLSADFPGCLTAYSTEAMTWHPLKVLSPEATVSSKQYLDTSQLVCKVHAACIASVLICKCTLYLSVR